MPKLLKLVAVLLMSLGVINVNSRETDELYPLKNYIEENAISDKVVRRHIETRCVALFAGMAGGLIENDDESSQNLLNRLKSNISILLDHLIKTSKYYKDSNKIAVQDKQSYERMIKSYRRKIDVVTDLGNNIMKDELIIGDTEICVQIVEAIR